MLGKRSSKKRKQLTSSRSRPLPQQKAGVSGEAGLSVQVNAAYSAASPHFPISGKDKGKAINKMKYSLMAKGKGGGGGNKVAPPRRAGDLRNEESDGESDFGDWWVGARNAGLV